MTQNYTLNLLNNRTKQTYKIFQVDGFNTVGVEELEDFTIVFRNNTASRVQARISVDGTDVLTGKPASTEPSGEMFIVNGYQSLDLKAWAEDNRGGASFLFTALKDSVAANTHGNVSSKGIIAVAIYEEGHVEKQDGLWRDLWRNDLIGDSYKSKNDYGMSRGNNTKGSIDTMDIDLCCERSLGLCDDADSDDINPGASSGREELTKGCISPRRMKYEEKTSGGILRSKNLSVPKNLGVGAGERVDQTITKVAGFKKPTFVSIMQIKYMDWAELRTRVRMDTNQLSYPHPGFPGDAEKMCNLGNTPRYKKVESSIDIGVVKRKNFNRLDVISKFNDISRFYE